MNKDTITKVAIGVGSLTVGVGAGYLVAKKQLEAKYQALAQDEIDQVRDLYKRRAKADQYETVSSTVEALVDAAVATEVDASTEDLEELRTILRTNDYAVDGEARVRRIFDEPEPTKEELGDPIDAPFVEAAEIDESRPYEITTDVFMSDDMPDKVTLTYYAMDDILADERDQPMTDIDDLIGEHHLDLLDEKNNVVYVRNTIINTDFEIMLQEGAYSVLVLGNTDEHLEPKKRRGPRMQDRE